jgi:hypothetical protein
VGTDPVTGRRHDLVEVIPPGPKAAAQAEAARTRLLNQVDERRNPRTNATVDQMLDKYFEVVDLELNTVTTYRGYADKHIRPLIGKVRVGALDEDVFDSFYAELRRCRDHCDRRPYVEHRTSRPHECDGRCGSHSCKPPAAGTIRQIHFILRTCLRRSPGGCEGASLLSGGGPAAGAVSGDGVDRGPAGHGLGDGWVGFVVAGEAAVRGEPGEGSLDRPAAWDDGGPALTGGFAHDLEGGGQEGLRPVERASGESAVGEDEPDCGRKVGGEQNRLRAVAVLACGGADRDGEEQAEGVGDDEPLAAVDLFPAW